MPAKFTARDLRDKITNASDADERQMWNGVSWFLLCGAHALIVIC